MYYTYKYDITGSVSQNMNPFMTTKFKESS